MQMQEQPPPAPQRDEPRRDAYEPAARKMEINEDYDDDGPEEKKDARPDTNGASKAEPN